MSRNPNSYNGAPESDHADKPQLAKDIANRFTNESLVMIRTILSEPHDLRYQTNTNTLQVMEDLKEFLIRNPDNGVKSIIDAALVAPTPKSQAHAFLFLEFVGSEFPAFLVPFLSQNLEPIKPSNSNQEKIRNKWVAEMQTKSHLNNGKIPDATLKTYQQLVKDQMDAYVSQNPNNQLTYFNDYIEICLSILTDSMIGNDIRLTALNFLTSVTKFEILKSKKNFFPAPLLATNPNIGKYISPKPPTNTNPNNNQNYYNPTGYSSNPNSNPNYYNPDGYSANPNYYANPNAAPNPQNQAEKGEERDAYEVLHVTSDAPQKVVLFAYRAMCLLYHPDQNQTPGADDKFKEINNAYKQIDNQKKRKTYVHKRT